LGGGRGCRRRGGCARVLEAALRDRGREGEEGLVAAGELVDGRSWHRYRLLNGVNEYEVARLREENDELRRLLLKHQWSGLTPVGAIGACPECAGSAPPFGTGHRPGCAIAAALDEVPQTA
jgi:hypothetical protein